VVVPNLENHSLKDSPLLLSIIVPIFNVEQYLEQCLHSIYSINSIDYEVILVNDGSPDNSHLIIDKFAKVHPNNTLVINRVNGGLSAARNSGLDVANGRYVAFIDSDDFIDPDLFTKHIKLTNEMDVDVGCGNGYVYSETQDKGRPLTFSEKIFFKRKTLDGIEYLERSFKNETFNNVTVWDKIYKRSYLEFHQFRFQEGLLHEDVPFTLKLLLSRPKVAYFDNHFYFYRVRAGSIINSWSEKNIESWNIILEIIFSELNQLDRKSKVLYDYVAYQIWVLYKKSGKYDENLVKKVLRKPLSIKKRLRLLYLLFVKQGS